MTLHDAETQSDLHRHYRGKQLVVLVGQKKALAMAIKGKQIERRWSKLKERLGG